MKILCQMEYKGSGVKMKRKRSHSALENKNANLKYVNLYCQSHQLPRTSLRYALSVQTIMSPSIQRTLGTRTPYMCVKLGWDLRQPHQLPRRKSRYLLRDNLVHVYSVQPHMGPCFIGLFVKHICAYVHIASFCLDYATKWITSF